MKHTSLLWILPVAMILAISCQLNKNTETAKAPKELFIPDTVYTVPDNNNYQLDTSEYAFVRMKETPNFALFWAKEYGLDPKQNPDSLKRFDADSILKQSERIYSYFVDELKFYTDDNSSIFKYKMLIYIFGGDEGSAFGGGQDEKIGAFWAPAIRMSRPPYGALAHEMGHSFQYLMGCDKKRSDSTAVDGVGSYSFFEMTSQFMLWQVYPEWMTFENYHLEGFMKQTHLAYLHEKNMYHSPYVLEYWSDKHDKTIISSIWRDSKKGEDPVITYKRITGIDQNTFNNEMYDAAARFMTWDLKRVRDVAKPYANQHSCKLNALADGWFIIDQSRCPQNYGYNGIKLKTPQTGTTVQLEFKGLAGHKGFRAINTEKAGWRYGFVAVKKDGTPVYGQTHETAEGQVSFQVPAQTEHLWLVVLGAPTEHWIHEIDGKDENDEEWPYKIRLTGTTIDNSAL
jgi:hypothetical protein